MDKFEGIYKNFIDYSEKNGGNLADDMKKEIKIIIQENTLDDASEKIMELILETKYEW